MPALVSVVGGLAALATFVAPLQDSTIAAPKVARPSIARQSVQPAFNDIPANLPGTVAGFAFEAQALSEFGDQVGLVANSAGQRILRSLRVVFTSGACQFRIGAANTCVTTPGATFSLPITANIYAVNNSGPVPAPGALLATVTPTLAVPYRPSEDPVHCPNTHNWFSAPDGRCFSSLAVTLQFDFPGNISLPSEVIWTVAFNTTNHGYHPIGPAPCQTLPAQCGYDALDVGVQTFPGAPFVGTVFDPNGAYVNSTNLSAYCDAGPTGVLRFTTSVSDCFAGFLPLAEILIAAVETPSPTPPPAPVTRRPGRQRQQGQAADGGGNKAINRQHDNVNLDYRQGIHHRSARITR